MWKIEKTISKGDYNYALVREHPKATKNRYVLEHRAIVENHLGRLLNPNEVVTCRCKFSRRIQLQGITHEVEKAISGNIVLEHKKYPSDNPEETV